MGFTGHERDFHTEGQIAGDSERDDLDYMHARYLGRRPPNPEQVLSFVEPGFGRAHCCPLFP
jgi:hypothetical protein